MSKDEKRLQIYQDAINRIDDYFEYRHESCVDKAFVMDVLDSLSNRLKSIYHTKDHNSD